MEPPLNRRTVNLENLLTVKAIQRILMVSLIPVSENVDRVIAEASVYRLRLPVLSLRLLSVRMLISEPGLFQQPAIYSYSCDLLPNTTIGYRER